LFNCSNPIDIISGECKYRKDGLNLPTLISIIEKLSDFESQINLIVTHKLYDNLLPIKKENNRSSSIKRIEQNFCILNAIHDKNQNSITLEEIYPPEYHSKTNMKVFILFSLNLE